MSNPAVISSCCLLLSMVGRSSFRSGVRARIAFADPKGTAYLGGRPSHLIFGELRKSEVQLLRIPLPRTPVDKDKKEGPQPSWTQDPSHTLLTLVSEACSYLLALLEELRRQPVYKALRDRFVESIRRSEAD